MGWAAYDRRQLRYIDAVRLGLADEAQRPAGEDLDADPWRVGWASGSDLDPRLREQWYVGPVESMAWGVADDRPFVAVAGEQLRVWDLLDRRSRLFPAERVRCLAFAASDVWWLVTGHDDGFLRIWDVAGGSLRAAIKTGDSVTGLRVVDTGDGPEAVTLHAHGHLVRWSLRSGKRVHKLKVPRSNAICEGRLADGRHVLASGGHGLALWDLAGGRRIELPISLAMWRAVDVQLSYVAGRDCLTVLNEYREVLTFDLESGEPIAPPLRDHVNRWDAEVMRAWGPAHRRPRLATIAGTVAVPTAWRVHLWDLEMSTRAARPLAGPVASRSSRRCVGVGRTVC